MEYKLEGEYIELNKLLKAVSLIHSGGMAKHVIKDGLVEVNGEVELQVRKKLRKGDLVNLEGQKVNIV